MLEDTRRFELQRQTESLRKGSTFHHARLINLTTYISILLKQYDSE